MKQSKDPFESPPPESPNSNSLKGVSEDEKDNMNVELAKFPDTDQFHKMAKMHSILSQFTDEQMKRFESFRRAKFMKAKMMQGGVDVGRRQVLDTKYAFNVSVLQRSAF
ncbi:transcription initiation factor TFIID subunit [Trifolium repens]|nr:transcription initiation factor TFIID subunit [Trifolium repens]